MLSESNPLDASTERDLSYSDFFFSSTNEKLDRSNFIEGTKLLGTYLHEVAAINA